MAQLVDSDRPGHPERAIVFTVQAWVSNAILQYCDVVISNIFV